ncbi:MAG: hypothetical protein ACI4M3_04535 [Acutalibacteraceae bacterium]
MRHCIKSGNTLAFGLGLIVSLIFPQCWVTAIVAVLVIVLSIVCTKCGRL